MILEFIKKGVTVIEQLRSFEKPSQNGIKDISFNLISDRQSNLVLQEDSPFLFVAIEIHLKYENQQILLEQWIFSMQNHEKRKNLNLLENYSELQLKLCNLLKTISCLLTNLPLYKSYSKLPGQITISRKTSFQSIDSFPQTCSAFPANADEYSVFFIDKQIKKFSFKLQYARQIEAQISHIRKISQESAIQQIQWVNNTPPSDDSFSMKEYDDLEENEEQKYFEGAFVNLQDSNQVRKMSHECSQRYDDCEFLQNSKDDMVADFIGEIQSMRNVPKKGKTIEGLFKDIQSFYYELQ